MTQTSFGDRVFVGFFETIYDLNMTRDLNNPIQSDTKGRLRMPTSWAHYFRASETEAAMIDPRTQEERVREFFAGHEFRIASLVQLRDEWSRPRGRHCRHSDWR